ncbi:MAG: SpoIIE family protein phosphatase [Clostridia bacterium]|nr:SpoIIE family protein phosphatase [Clostridia bacterium]
MEIRMQKGMYAPHSAQKRNPGGRILFYILAFFLSESALFGEILPFGIALFAAQYISSPPYLLGFIVIVSSFIPLCLPGVVLKYALSIVLFSVLASKKGQAFTKTPLRRGALMGGSVFVSGLFLLLGGQILIYDCFVLFLEAGITWIFTILFASATQAMTRDARFSAPLDILSVSALCGTCVLGLSSFFSLYGLYVTVPFSVLCVLLLTHESGITFGAIAGITLGLFATLDSGDPVLGAFAAAGMAAGYFSKYGRGGAVAAFIASYTAVSYYVGGSTETSLRLYEIAAPALIYLAIPAGLLGKLSKSFDDLHGGDLRSSSLLSEDLREKADAFTFLSETFTEISENRYRQFSMAAAAFFEKGARRACEGCPLLASCWKKEFHRTYAAFFVMLEICKKNGFLSREDIPVSLAEKCVRRTMLADRLNAQYEIYKVDRLWEARMQECRRLLSRQLSAVAHILSVMERNIKNSSVENSALSALLNAQLTESGISVFRVSVTEKKRGTPFVVLSAPADTPGQKLIPIISDVIGKPMHLLSAHGGRFSFAPSYRVHLRTWGETVPKNNSPKSGDCFEDLYLENGCQLLMLSDGMGSGEKAHLESSSALRMLRALFSAGFDTDTALGLVNSLLVLKSAEDSFATVDLFSLNTGTLKGEFMKVGAAASFVKRGNAVRTFSADSLPAGILPSHDAARLSVDIEPGDMIIMLSDGVFDPMQKAQDTLWVEAIIRAYEGDDPRALGRTILDKARELCRGQVGDDMTVLCATVCKNEDFVA